MADTTTTTYSLTKPEVGASADTWGTKLNTNFDTIDDLLDGTTAIAPNLSTLKIGGTAVTSTATELNYVDGVTSNIQTQIDNINTDLVNDTTPQLGGTLDTNSNAINDASGVTLQHNGSRKLTTTADGIKIGDATTLDSSGSWDAIQIGAMGWLGGYGSGGDATSLELSGNGYLNGSNSWTYAATEQASKINMTDGTVRFFGAASGTAGTAITWTEVCRMETDGDLHAEGDVIAYSTTISDERLKENIQPIDDALAKVKQLKGCTFTYKADGKDSAGLIAQDVEKVLPSAVSEKELPLKTDDGIAYKTVQYDQTIGLLVEAIKELTAKVEELENK